MNAVMKVTKYSLDDAKKFNKFGVNIFAYPLKGKDFNIVYEEVEKGHYEEFLNVSSTYTWFIIEGKGLFVVNDEKINVKSKDIISIPPKSRIHYFGDMKMLLICTPAFDKKNEKHLKYIKES